jgi:subtilase family serine protease
LPFHSLSSLFRSRKRSSLSAGLIVLFLIGCLVWRPATSALASGKGASPAVAGHPDVAYNASAVTSILLYFSFRGADEAGYYNVGGTSEGAPQWAGITAIADQFAHRSLGFLNPAIYRIGNSPLYPKLFHDVTVGTNTINGVTGYNAGPGWDLTTGWGTPDLGGFIQALCAAS